MTQVVCSVTRCLEKNVAKSGWVTCLFFFLFASSELRKGGWGVGGRRPYGLSQQKFGKEALKQVS